MQTRPSQYSNPPNVINYSWSDIEQLCVQLASEINRDHYSVDQIITIQRGGLIPATIISHLLGNRNILTIDIKRTTSDSVNAPKQQPRLYSKIDNCLIKNKNILIVDDIIGSGETINKLLSNILRFHPKIVKTAILLLNWDNFDNSPHKNTLTLDYLGSEIRGWAVFPWEKGVVNP